MNRPQLDIAYIKDYIIIYVYMNFFSEMLLCN